MMQTVKQLADELGVSKQAVHKKIEKMGIKNELKTVNRRLMVDDNHAKAIRKAFFAESDAEFRQPTVNQLTTTTQEQEQTGFEAFSVEKDRQPVDNISSTNRQPVDDNHENADTDRVCTVNQPKKEPDYSNDYVQSLLARIEGLEADKADLKAEKVQLQQEKEKMQQRIDEKDAHIMEITERLTVLLKNEQDRTALQAAPAAETVEVVQPADAAEPEPEKKKPWWKFW